VATWGGFVFLHLTPDEAAPLADQLGAELPLVVTQEQFSYFRPADPAPSRSAGSRSGSGWTFPASTASRSGPAPPSRSPRTSAAAGSRPPPAASTPTRPPPNAWPGSCAPACPPPPAPTTTATCLYTLTPDRDLVLGPLPGHDRVLVALGAAHGFKFAPHRPALTAAEPEDRYLV
jgi:sarcosine oxidase